MIGAKFKQKGDKTKYSFVDIMCIGRQCFCPGMYQHRAPLAGGGSRNTGSPDTPCCLNNAHRGCPEGPVGEYKEFDEQLKQTITHIGLPEYSVALVRQRKAEGWRRV